MDELIEKLSLYDCLVRLITGGLVILITYYSDLVDTFWEVGDSSIIVFVFCSYGVGMILEEVSYMLKMRRKNNRNETCVENNEEWNKKKGILLRDNKEYISDEPLAHKVMADSIEIASVLIILWKVINTVYINLVCEHEVDILGVSVVMNATEAEIHEKLAVTESKVVITVDLALEKIVQASRETSVKHIIGVSLAESMPCVIGTLYKWKSKIKQENCILFSEFLKAGQGKKIDCQEIKADAPAVIAYTGGTTGKAKGVLLSNRAANTIAFQYKYADKVLDFQNGERFLDIIPPFFSLWTVFGVHMALCTCLEDVLCPDPAPERLPKLFTKYRPNHLSGGPLHMEAMTKDRKIQKMNLSFAKTVAYGGDGMNQEWEDEMSKFLKVIRIRMD